MPFPSSLRLGRLVITRWNAEAPERAERLSTALAISTVRAVARSDHACRLLEWVEALGEPPSLRVMREDEHGRRLAAALERLERALETGSLVAYEIAPAKSRVVWEPALRSERWAPIAAPAAPALAPQAPVSAPVDPKSWIEICLVGEDDRPVRGEPYRLTLPDGRVMTGTTDSEGMIRVRQLRPGSCEICFDALDEAAWGVEPAGA